MAADVHLDVQKDGITVAVFDSLRNFRGHVVDHYRHEMMAEWSSFVQDLLRRHGVRVRKGEALQITRFFCHSRWDDGKTMEHPLEIVNQALEAMGILVA